MRCLARALGTEWQGQGVSVMVEAQGSEAGWTSEVAYYYPAPYWRMHEGDWLKSLLLFFDRIAILLPSYMRGREVDADPVLAGPLAEKALLQVLEPETFVDQDLTEALSLA